MDKQAAYYNSYLDDNPYREKIRTFTDARCDTEGVGRLDWENWKYVHKTVYLYTNHAGRYWEGRHYN